jgi:hypothetical protein
MMSHKTISLVAFAVVVFLASAGGRAESLALAAERGALRGVLRSLERGEARSLNRQVVRSLDRRTVRSLERSRLHDLTRRDLLIHKYTRPVPVTNPRGVFRFTTRDRALSDLRRGIAPNRHMTSHVSPGRQLSADSAVRRFGLLRLPEVRETILIPRGQPIRSNKVVGGAPGVGEVTSTRRLPPKAIKHLVPIR